MSEMKPRGHAWEAKLVEALEGHDLALADVVDNDSVAEMMGLNVYNWPLSYRAKRSGLPPPPQPVFKVQSSFIWLKADIEKWIEPYLARKGVKPLGPSGYRGVTPHRHSGTWRAVLIDPSSKDRISGGYYHSAEDAARAVDFLRWERDLPPVNFPDDLAGTLARMDEWTTRHSFGRRGVEQAIIEALRGRELDAAGVLELIADMDTTPGSVSTTLRRLSLAGTIRRVRYGVYTADPSSIV